MVDHYIEAAKMSRVDALHPGYGFLSENAAFVDMLEQKNITFIGPSSSAIRSMGSKAESKRIMESARVPVVPGYHGEQNDPEHLLSEAKKIGFPVMLKASLGGGGKGMRIVRSEREFMQQLESAKNEARKGFNDDHMIIEKYIEKPRHIEVQVFGDKHGNYLYLNERDCTVQRRHQKIIEEAPSSIDETLRQQMGEAACAAAKAVGYYNAGTVEFIYDTESNKYYFMEMNTRLQVEHPVTEMITGQDLVEWQLRVAAGQKLPITSQKDVPLIGYSLEARIYAEDPDNGFLPQSGKIKVLREPKQLPGKVRIDTGVREGDVITTFYDPMISKLIVHADTREKAIHELNAQLENYQVIGLPTNIKFLKKVLKNPIFQSGKFDTSFIEKNEANLLKKQKEFSYARMGTIALVKVWLETLQHRTKRIANEDPWAIRDNFRLNHQPMRDLVLTDDDGNESEFFVQYVNENTFNVFRKDDDCIVPLILDGEVHMSPDKPDELVVRDDNHQYIVDFFMDPNTDEVTQLDYDGAPLKYSVKRKSLMREGEGEGGAAADHIKSPMPGTVVKVFVQPGEQVSAGQNLASIESMKMEYMIKATHDTTVSTVDIKEGQFVQMKQRMVSFAQQ